jgi:hypothetical protein
MVLKKADKRWCGGNLMRRGGWWEVVMKTRAEE